jgi:hypothetical protein
MKDTYIAKVVRLARRHPAHVPRLAAAAADPKLRAALEQLEQRLAKPLRREPEPGKATRSALTAWLASPGRTTDDVVAYVRGEPRPSLLRVAVTGFADTSGKVAAAALAASADRTVASAVLTSPTAPTLVRQQAARRLVAPTEHLSRALYRPISELMAADPAFASEMVLACGDVYVTRAAMIHADLTADAVEIVEARLTGGRVFVRPHDWVWVATHPNAGRELRVRALRVLERRLSMAGGRASATEGNKLAGLVAWAAAGVAATEVGNAAAGAQLPCPAVREIELWDQTPGLAPLLTAALTTQLAACDDSATASILAALATDFAGTVAELVMTLEAVAG